MGRGPVTQKKIDMILKLNAKGVPQNEIRRRVHVGSQTMAAVLKGKMKKGRTGAKRVLREWDAVTIYTLNRCVIPENMWIYSANDGQFKGVVRADTAHEAERRVMQMYADQGDEVTVELEKVWPGMDVYFPDVFEVYCAG